MRAHATQIALWEGDGTIALAMSNLIAQPLLDVEEYVAAEGAGGRSAREPIGDLFDDDHE
jgi:N-acetyl-1-D-myo-inositol-2-amino-2-deoxy-alpha-D-glucopyranoside deacetylase